MKKLIDGTTVLSRTYYYLLDFNDMDNWKTILTLFNKNKLCELTLNEYRQLFKVASTYDYRTL